VIWNGGNCKGQSFVGGEIATTLPPGKGGVRKKEKGGGELEVNGRMPEKYNSQYFRPGGGWDGNKFSTNQKDLMGKERRNRAV